MGEAVHTDPFIDDIYEAAVVPEKWQAILDRLAEMADDEGTLLFAAGPGAPRWLASEAIQRTVEEWIGSKWYLDNPRGQRLVPIEEPRFLTDLDALTADEIDASDYYTELLRPRGLGWCVGTTIRSPAGDTLVFSIEKAHSKGPVPRMVAEQLDRLRPHLARASLLFRASRAGPGKIHGGYAGSDRAAGGGVNAGRSRRVGERGIPGERAAHPHWRRRHDPA
jgi:hypothetical protein